MKRIAVGSKNPVKIAAVRNVVSMIWKDSNVIAVDVPSGVGEQPMSDEEAIRGALNRAKASMERTDADVGVGIEGCIVDNEYGMFLSGWTVVTSKRGEIGIGSGNRLLLPEPIASQLRKGKELGPVVDEIVGGTGIKEERGVIGFLTSNMITRVKATEAGLICAMARFLNPGFYE